MLPKLFLILSLSLTILAQDEKDEEYTAKKHNQKTEEKSSLLEFWEKPKNCYIQSTTTMKWPPKKMEFAKAEEARDTAADMNALGRNDLSVTCETGFLLNGVELIKTDGTTDFPAEYDEKTKKFEYTFVYTCCEYPQAQPDEDVDPEKAGVDWVDHFSNFQVRCRSGGITSLSMNGKESSSCAVFEQGDLSCGATKIRTDLSQYSSGKEPFSLVSELKILCGPGQFLQSVNGIDATREMGNAANKRYVGFSYKCCGFDYDLTQKIVAQKMKKATSSYNIGYQVSFMDPPDVDEYDAVYYTKNNTGRVVECINVRSKKLTVGVANIMSLNGNYMNCGDGWALNAFQLKPTNPVDDFGGEEKYQDLLNKLSTNPGDSGLWTDYKEMTFEANFEFKCCKADVNAPPYEVKEAPPGAQKFTAGLVGNKNRRIEPPFEIKGCGSSQGVSALKFLVTKSSFAIGRDCSVIGSIDPGKCYDRGVSYLSGVEDGIGGFSHLIFMLPNTFQCNVGEVITGLTIDESGEVTVRCCSSAFDTAIQQKFSKNHQSKKIVVGSGSPQGIEVKLMFDPTGSLTDFSGIDAGESKFGDKQIDYPLENIEL